MQISESQLTVNGGSMVSVSWASPDGGPDRTEIGLILAHGAANDMRHPLIAGVQRELARRGCMCACFNFPYAEAGRKSPDRMPVLSSTWRTVVEAVRNDPVLAPRHLFLGGKSLGGRIASLIVAEGEACRGLVFLGYPLHPPGQPERRRVEHWRSIPCPTLFVQGSRDSLCALQGLQDEFSLLPIQPELHVIAGVDHSFKCPACDPRTPDELVTSISQTIETWMRKVATTPRPR